MANPLQSQDGDVHWNGSQVAHARGWTIDINTDAQTYTTNRSNGKVQRRPGNIDVTGTFTIYADGAALPCLPGEIALLRLYVNSTQFWAITNAIIVSISPEVDIEGNALEGVTVNWAFAGQDTATGGTITAPDGSTLDKDSTGEIAES